MSSPRARRLLFVVLAAVTIAPVTAFHRADAAPQWATIANATIRPSNATTTGPNGCTSSFVFTSGNEVLLGQAAHCAGTDGNTATNGCTSHSMPLGTRVDIEGAANPGTLVYSSWLAMQAGHEPNPNACQYNDFALVRLDPLDWARVNPTLPHWGGPTGVDGNGSVTGDKVYAYGNSSLKLGINLLRPMQGQSRGSIGAVWGHQVNTLLPGIPGDSGSGYINAFGQAMGTLSTVGVRPIRGVVNNLSDLNFAMIYARAHGVPNLQLAKGTQGFDPKGHVG